MRAITPLVAIISMLLIRSVSAAEVDLRGELLAEVQFHLSRDSFSELESLHTRLNNPSERLPSGVWKLFFFYVALQRSIHNNADPAYWTSLEQKAARWSKQHPLSLVVPIYRAEIYRGRAWTHRGTALAKDVRDWAPVTENAQKAHDALVQAGPKARDNPEWYAAMFRVLNLHKDDPDEFGRLLSEGMSKHPNYHSMYFAASWSLQPKWGGSEEAISALATEAAKRSASMEGAAMYTRIYWYLDQSVYKGDIFRSSKAEWPRMRAGFDDIVAKYPEPWNLNSYAYFSCLAGDQQTLRRLLGKIGEQLDFSAWGQGQKRFYDRCVQTLEPRRSTPAPAS